MAKRLMNKSFQSVLFLSTGRTGTAFLASILRDTVPNVDVYHEAGGRSRLINILSHANLAGLTSSQLTISVWQRTISGAIAQSQDNNHIYIDANNHLYNLAVKNPHLYPNLKVVHIVRDPRTYIRSHLNWSQSRFKSFLANYLIPFWQPTGYMVGEMGLGKWFKLSKIERFAWVWQYKNKFINQLENSSTPYLWIRFEDLFSLSDPGLTYQKILEFIGIKNSSQVEGYFYKFINAGKPSRLPGWMQWPDPLCRKIHLFCKDGMEQFGYGNEPDWIKKISPDGVAS